MPILVTARLITLCMYRAKLHTIFNYTLWRLHSQYVRVYEKAADSLKAVIPASISQSHSICNHEEMRGGVILYPAYVKQDYLCDSVGNTTYVTEDETGGVVRAASSPSIPMCQKSPKVDNYFDTQKVTS
jgi:hypothetical protein